MAFELQNNPFAAAKVLVTGGTGFIGSRLVATLLSLGAKVDSLGVTDKPVVEGATKVICDLADRVSVQRKLKQRNYDYVFNLGGYIGHAAMAEGGRDIFQVHMGGLLNLVEAVSGPSLKGFVQVGSSDEYGDSPSPQVETLREAPISPYSLAKTAATHFIQMQAKTQDFPGVATRLFLTYGPGQDMQRFFPQIITGCLQAKEFPTSEGRQLRDFCFVDDTVEGLLLAATTEKAHGEVINIASGKPIQIRDAIMMIRDLVGAGTPKFGEVAYRPGESMSLYADVSKAQQLLGWQAQSSMEEGLKQTISFFRASHS